MLVMNIEQARKDICKHNTQKHAQHYFYNVYSVFQERRQGALGHAPPPS